MTTSGRPGLYADYSHALWRRVLFTRQMAIIGLFVLVVIVASAIVPHFANTMTVYYLCQNMLPNMMIALPMALIMITADIDVSVGSMVSLSCSVLGLLYSSGVPFELSMLLALLVGALGGFLNGWLVTRVDLPALAVTIGTMAMFSGVAVGLLGTNTITSFPPAWTNMAQWELGHSGIPFTMLIFVVLLAVFVYVLHFTSFGRGVFAIGLNKQAATFSGVKVARTRMILFVLTGTVSALGGIYWTLLYSTARGDMGTGLELQVIAAVVLGGVSVFGGRGALHGVVAGVLLIAVLSSALQLLSVTAEVINIITGVLLVGSVVIASFSAWLRDRRPRAVVVAAAESAP